MSEIIFKVDFNRYDEDIISVISGTTRYFRDARKADDAIAEWCSKSERNETVTNVVEVE